MGVKAHGSAFQALGREAKEPFGAFRNRLSGPLSLRSPAGSRWEFPKIRVPYFGVLIIRILLFRVLYSGPLFSETPGCSCSS